MKTNGASLPESSATDGKQGPLPIRLFMQTGEEVPASVVDISMGGAGLLSESLPQPGDIVTVELGRTGPEEGSAPVRLRAEVRHTSRYPRNKFRVGLRFVMSGAEEISTVETLVKRFEKRGARRAQVWQK